MCNMYDLIQKILADRHMSKKDLAGKAGIPYSSLISAFNRRSESFSSTYIQKIASALGVSVGDLMGWDDFDSQHPHLGEEVKLLEDAERLGGSTWEMLEPFSRLNATGKQKAIAYINDLALIKEYCEPSSQEKTTSAQAEMQGSELAEGYSSPSQKKHGK